MTLCKYIQIILNHIMLYHKQKKGPVGLMSSRANVRRASDHRATFRSSYCPIGLLSSRFTASRATIHRANVRSGCCLSSYCPVGLMSVGVVSSGWLPSGYCLGTVQTSRLQF